MSATASCWTCPTSTSPRSEGAEALSPAGARISRSYDVADLLERRGILTALLRAERDWLTGIVADIRGGRLTWQPPSEGDQR
jgi:hypothetical protein